MAEIPRIRGIVAKERIIEQYYGAVKEIIIAIMYCEGIKSLSHIELVEYIVNNYQIGSDLAKLLDELRIKRNDITYYGKEINENFIRNNENDILLLASKLKDILAIKLDS